MNEVESLFERAKKESINPFR